MPLTPSPAVLRACDLLGELAKHPTERFSVSDLARSVGTARATCDSILMALAQRGFVHRSADRRYSLGVACRVLGDAAQAAGAGLIAIEPLAEALASATSTCVAISSCDGVTCRVERMFDAAPGISMRARVGESVPLAPPFGAVFVAWDERSVDRWLDRAGGTLSDAERHHARAALAAVRTRGYALSTDVVRPDLVNLLADLADGTSDPSKIDARDTLMRSLAPSRYLPITVPADTPQRVAQVTAPVFDAMDRVPYSLMILGPGYDLRPDEVRGLAERLVDAAQLASARLGAIGAEPAADGTEPLRST